MRFDGRVAVVTGAGRGIGRAEAVFLAERGAAVVVNDLGSTTAGDGESEGPAHEVAQEIAAAGGTAVASTSTVSTPEGAQAIVDLAIERFGRVDVVVNNAGILDSGRFPDITPADLQRQLDVHLLGSFNVTRAAWPHLAAQGYGRVVMTVSSAGLYGMPAQLAYGAAKGGVVGLMRSLACLGPDAGIMVNAMGPGAYTRMVDTLSDENFKAFSKATRTPAAVAPIVTVLAHESCPVNGEIFMASSGRVARAFIAETPGYFKLGHTPEDLLANWGTVVADDGFHLPASAGENVHITLERLRAEGISVPDLQGLPEFSRARA
ncbi:MAG: hypothetical protein ABS81_09600 [Pseudonocardia sp. SCN 72-86]|nr:MAG: hypothetical protein ABS81_09600 [Pseudonocardia sp. SCN 72-86]